MNPSPQTARHIEDLEQGVYHAYGFFEQYWSLAGEPEFTELVEVFERKPFAYRMNRMAARIAMVVTVSRFWETNGQHLECLEGGPRSARG